MRTNLSKHKGIINEKTLLATVDFGKFRNVGYCRCPDGSELSSIEFCNSGEGFKEFWSNISWLKRRHNLTEVVVGFESTGPYAEPLLHFLRKRDVKLVQVNCVHTKKVKELYDNSPNKNDDKDPKVLADIIELGRFLSVVIPEGVVAELRRLIHARERHQQRRKTLYNQLHDAVYLLFPEFLSVMRDIGNRSSQYLLSHYPSPQAIVQLGKEALESVLRRVSHGRFGQERAQALFQAAQASVGLLEGQNSIVDEISQLLSLISRCDEFIMEIEQKLEVYLQEVPYSRCILTIKGLGTVTVAALIGEVGDFDKFKTISELLKYSGLNLYEISSGRQKGRRRISKRGRPLIRKFLYFASLNVVRKGGILHEQYQAYLKRGMLPLKALVALGRKLLGIIFALVRDRTHYNADYLNANAHLLKKAA